MTRNEAPRDDAAFRRLKAFFTDDEIVELTWTIGLFNMLNRIHDALQFDIEGQEEVDKIRRSRYASEAAVLDYIRRVLALAESRTRPTPAAGGATAPTPHSSWPPPARGPRPG